MLYHNILTCWGDRRRPLLTSLYLRRNGRKTTASNIHGLTTRINVGFAEKRHFRSYRLRATVRRKTPLIDGSWVCLFASQRGFCLPKRGHFSAKGLARFGARGAARPSLSIALREQNRPTVFFLVAFRDQNSWRLTFIRANLHYADRKETDHEIGGRDRENHTPASST